MSKYYNLKYRCQKCLEIYDEMYDAEVCCDATIPIYECYHCGTRYTEFQDVVNCCQEQDASVKMPWSQICFPVQEKFSK